MYSLNHRSISLLIFVLSICRSSVLGKKFSIAWRVPPQDDPYLSQTAKVGDTVSFTWSAGHNVYIYPTKTCDKAGAKLVSETSVATYEFKEDDVGKVVFACDVYNHCKDGQIITFTVESDLPSTPSTPSPPPIPAPSSYGSPYGSPKTPSPTTSASVGLTVPVMQGFVLMLLFKLL